MKLEIFKIKANEKISSFLNILLSPIVSLVELLDKKRDLRYRNKTPEQLKKAYDKASTQILKRVFKELYEYKFLKESKFLVIGERYSFDAYYTSNVAESIVDFLTSKEIRKFPFVYESVHKVPFANRLAEEFENNSSFEVKRTNINDKIQIAEIYLKRSS